MDEKMQRREEGLAGAVQNLSNGVTKLVRSQFELIRLEVKQEATEAGARGANMFVSIGVALLGYGFLLLAIIIGVGWAFGLGGMALAALAVGLAHLVGGLVYANAYAEEFREQRERLEHKTRSLSEEPWLEENPET